MSTGRKITGLICLIIIVALVILARLAMKVGYYGPPWIFHALAVVAALFVGVNELLEWRNRRQAKSAEPPGEPN